MSCRTRRKVVGAVYNFLAYVLLLLAEPTVLVSASCKCQGRYLIAIKLFLFSGHEPIYFIENKEKTLRASYDRGT